MLAYLRRVLPGASPAHWTPARPTRSWPHWGVVTERLVSAVAGRGAELFVWTVDDAARLRACASSG